MRWFVLLYVCAAAGCSPDLSDDAIPYASFSDIVLNLSLSEFAPLKSKGYQYIDGGIRGIIVRQVNGGTYYAIERNCSYQPNSACATVDVHSSGLYLFDPCCSSNFDLEGNPTGGAAWRPLRRYEATLNGTTLTITDTVVN